MLFLIAALMLLGFGASALAAENVETSTKGGEVSYDQCSINGRLKFKDGKDGCLVNHPTFLKQGQVSNFFYNRSFTLSLSLNPAQCPAVYGATWGLTSASSLSNCKNKLQMIIGTASSQCECQAFEEIAQNLSKDEFYEFERAYASRLKTGWSMADLTNSTSVAQSPVIPEAAKAERRQIDALAKADEDRRQKEALAKDTQTSAKAEEVSFDRCYMGARLQFKDGKDGCLQNNRYFSNLDNVKGVLTNKNFNLALSLNHAQCPAVSGAWSWGNYKYLDSSVRLNIKQVQLVGDI